MYSNKKYKQELNRLNEVSMLFGQGALMKEITDRSLWSRSSRLDKTSSSNFGLQLMSGQLDKMEYGNFMNRDCYLGEKKSQIAQFLGN
jgi:hypothetical protein